MDMKNNDHAFENMSEEDRQAYIEQETRNYDEWIEWQNNMTDEEKQEFAIELMEYRIAHDI